MSDPNALLNALMDQQGGALTLGRKSPRARGLVPQALLGGQAPHSAQLAAALQRGAPPAQPSGAPSIGDLQAMSDQVQAQDAENAQRATLGLPPLTRGDRIGSAFKSGVSNLRHAPMKGLQALGALFSGGAG